MKKIIIVSNKMVYGGIEKSLLELLNLLYKKYDITLVLNSLDGELFSEIPDEVHVKRMFDYSSFFEFFLENKSIISRIVKIYRYIHIKLSRSYDSECLAISRLYPCIKEKYDLAIAYSTPVSLPNYYVIHNIIAKKKIMFIHNDIKEINISPLNSRKVYSKYDTILAVSNHAKASFIDIFPELNDKVQVFYNLVNSSKIKRLSLEEIDLKPTNAIKLCTVGRLEYEKGQDIIPKIIKNLNNKGIKVKWYLVGDGEIRNRIEKNAKIEGVEDEIEYVGFQSNPYKYMRVADIYVQTSRQEGFCITLTEAKILNKIIITTNFPCAYEQIDNKVNGIIVDFNDIRIADAIANIINDKKMREKIKNALKLIDNSQIELIDEFLVD